MRLDAFRYRLPLDGPLHLAGVTLPSREGILLRLSISEGTAGWGDVAPLPGFSRETLDDVVQVLPALRERLRADPLSPDVLKPNSAFAARIDQWRLPPSLRYGLELAAADVFAGRHGSTIAHVLAPYPRELLRLNALITTDARNPAAEARRVQSAGYRTLKLKVGRASVDEDIRRVRRTAAVLHPETTLRLDANRAWEWEQAAAFFASVRGLPIAYIEEPLAAPAALPLLARTYPYLPVALDETLAGLPPPALDDHAYARAVILKPTLLGGIVPTLRQARRAATLGMTPVLSAAFESGVGVRGLVALGTVLPGPASAHGLGVYERLADDVLAPRLGWSDGEVAAASLLATERVIRYDMLEPVP